MIVRLNEIQEKVICLINNPTAKTFSLGFDGLDKFYKVVLGSTTYIGGQPSHGKTEWLLEVLVRLSQIHGFRHLIYSPETGNAEKIYLEITCKYLSKVYRENAFNRITEIEFIKASAFVNEYFIVRDMTDKTPTPSEFIKEIDSLVKEMNIQTISIDPWNEMLHHFGEAGSRQDLYLEVALTQIRKYARKNNLHFFVVTHPKTLIKNKSGGYDAPTAYDLSGGATWFSKADSILCVYRPFEFSESNFERSFVSIIIQKAKPKEVGIKGEFEAVYDWNTGRYSERNREKSYEGQKLEIKEDFIIEQKLPF